MPPEQLVSRAKPTLQERLDSGEVLWFTNLPNPYSAANCPPNSYGFPPFNVELGERYAKLLDFLQTKYGNGAVEIGRPYFEGSRHLGESLSEIFGIYIQASNFISTHE